MSRPPNLFGHIGDGSGEGGGRTGDVSGVSDADNGGVIDVDQSTSSSSASSSISSLCSSSETQSIVTGVILRHSFPTLVVVLACALSS
ncbi:hypothetical protein ECG_08168 [Echinococcus granulosus]|nr:hypothetical protein ECG_08168 [Echinococcus granulosus]